MLQYCEYYPEYEKCKQWLERNMPTEFERVKLGKYYNLCNHERKCVVDISSPIF